MIRRKQNSLFHREMKGSRWLRAGGTVACRSLPALVVMAQFVWFSQWYPQPTVYDAGQYVALSRQFEWIGPLPVLLGGGIRTYAYPLLLHLASTQWGFTHALQAIGLAALLTFLRHVLLPRSIRIDVSLAGCLAALPVLVPYAIVLLADLPGLICLQFSLVLVALAMSCEGSARWMRLGVGGLLLGAAIQLRPAYSPMAFVVVGWVAWMMLRGRSLRSGVEKMLVASGILFSGIVLSATPTIVANVRDEGRVGVLPVEGTERLRGYHLMLGLWMDRWSSNPPPIEERDRVAREWRERGWAILPIPPHPYPKVEDYWKEVEKDPIHAAGQFVRHGYHGFAKAELFPYVGQPPPWVQAWIWACNWVVLGLGLHEMLRQARDGANPVARSYAILNLILAALLVVTCGLVVPEERFTLAIYPSSFIFAAAWLSRRIALPTPDALCLAAA